MAWGIVSWREWPCEISENPLISNKKPEHVRSFTQLLPMLFWVLLCFSPALGTLCPGDQGEEDTAYRSPLSAADFQSVRPTTWQTTLVTVRIAARRRHRCEQCTPAPHKAQLEAPALLLQAPRPDPGPGLAQVSSLGVASEPGVRLPLTPTLSPS